MAIMKLFVVADEWEPIEPLHELLRDQGHDVEAFGVDAVPADLAPYGAGFMYVHRALAPDLERALVGYARAGGRLIALHHGLASAKVANPEWMDLAGLHIAPRDDPGYPWRVVGGVRHTVVNLCPDHFITTHAVPYERHVEYTSSDAPSRAACFAAFDLPDTELFLNQHFVDGRVRTVLFGAMCTDPEDGSTIMQDRGGWVRPTNAGHLIYLQPGHTAADFQHPCVRQILLNCLHWDGRS